MFAIHRMLKVLTSDGEHPVISDETNPQKYPRYRSTVFTTHWSLGKFPEAISDKDVKIYRVHERSVGLAPSRSTNAGMATRLPSEGEHDLVIIQDYDRGIRYDLKFGEESKSKCSFEAILERTRVSENSIRCVIGVASRLPDFVYSERPGEWTQPNSFWRRYSDDVRAKNDTIVITSLDRLRQDAAYVSKRKSWDRTVDDFVEELDYFPPLQKLGEFRHLVVRVGVSAAFLVSNLGNTRTVKFFYDPHAPGGVFRDLRFQGNIFLIRSTFAAALGEASHQANVARAGWNTKQPGTADANEAELVERAINKALRINQYLYKKGFGSTLDEVRNFTQRWKDGKVISKSDIAELERQVINVSTPPQSPYVVEWGLLTGNMRCEICEGDPEKLAWLEALRRLRCAKLIVMGGLHAAVNQRSVPDALADLVKNNPERFVDDQLAYESAAFANPAAHAGLNIRHQLEEISHPAVDDTFSTGEHYAMSIESSVAYEDCVNLPGWRDWVNSIKNEILGGPETTPESSAEWGELFKKVAGRKDYLPDDLFAIERSPASWRQIHRRLHELYGILAGTYPFNFPVAKFGHLLAAGQHTVESYTSVKILIRGYLKDLANQKRPLCLAAFGPPGSGKSFGIKQIAAELSSSIEVIECNLTQIESREELGRVFFQVANSLSKNRVPLVFFDEFDASNDKDALYPWLKHFLQPMQDGDYGHRDGRVNVTPAIFIFAGGTSTTFSEFVQHAEAEEGKKAKGPDFISRLRAHIDIPEINSTAEQGFNPLKKRAHYISRALLIRGILAMKGFIDNSETSPKRKKGDTGLAKIDGDIARAMLTVSRYRHGTRSIEALLDMCQAMQGRIVKASLPTVSQLNMHTVGIEFLVRVQFPHLHWFHEQIAVFGQWSRGKSFDPRTCPPKATWCLSRFVDKHAAGLASTLATVVKRRQRACGFGAEHFHYKFDKELDPGFRFLLILDDSEYVELALTETSKGRRLHHLSWDATERKVPSDEILERAGAELSNIGEQILGGNPGLLA